MTHREQRLQIKEDLTAFCCVEYFGVVAKDLGPDVHIEYVALEFTQSRHSPETYVEYLVYSRSSHNWALWGSLESTTVGLANLESLQNTCGEIGANGIEASSPAMSYGSCL